MNSWLSKFKVDPPLDLDNPISLSGFTKLANLEGSEVENFHIITSPFNNFEDPIQNKNFNFTLKVQNKTVDLKSVILRG